VKTPRILLSGIAGNRRNYELAIHRAGGKPLSCYCPSLQIPADGLLLAGGGDITPSFLGEEDRASRDTDLARDIAEFSLVQAFLAQGKPIFGICRGHQVMNVAMGGTLFQDIGLELERFHSPVPQGATQDVLHPIATKDGSLMAALYGPLVTVNSWHHQAVDRAGDGLVVTAVSESGLIEATEHRVRPLFSVQFHPERLRPLEDDLLLGDGAKLFAHFIRCCQEQMEGGEERS